MWFKSSKSVDRSVVEGDETTIVAKVATNFTAFLAHLGAVDPEIAADCLAGRAALREQHVAYGDEARDLVFAFAELKQTLDLIDRDIAVDQMRRCIAELGLNENQKQSILRVLSRLNEFLKMPLMS